MRYCQTLVEDFLDFVQGFDPHGRINTHVSDYFNDWMRDGDAIEATTGDHALFLQVFLLVADRFAREPDLFGNKIGIDRECPMEGLIRPAETPGEAQEPPDCMQPDYWNLTVLRRKYGMRLHS